uniref:Uncharacterized protein n=1 Tax=Siphoviridae sp. ctgaU3 TaxID=2825609 RepID=A0A8S5UW14_9CAUD|nr:MAG TPA: hypothetical protein [Siphoviridae sp. ctgaU3]
MNAAAKLTQAAAPDYAGAPLTRWTLTLEGEYVFQDVDQWGLPYDGSPAGGLYDDLCDRLILMGRLDADALNAL